MPPYRLIPNSPRARMTYVLKSLGQKVARDTVFVVAHTVGVDAFDFSSITPLREAGGADAEELNKKVNEAMIESFPDGPPHPAEALIPWVGQRLAAQQKEVRKGRLDEREYDRLVESLERMLPQIATWVHHTRPDLTKLSIADAMSQAAVFEDPGASSAVPQGEVIYRFADGWTIQNLTKPEQIFADGIHVQNCLRKDRHGLSYAADVQDGATKIFSLRKPSGIPVISIEYNVPNKHFNQIYAKQNTPLGIRLEDLLEQDTWLERPVDARILWENIQQYKPRIAEFLTAFGADAAAFIMADATLPAGLTSVGGGLDLRNYNHPLPARLTGVGGDLRLANYEHPLPAGLTSVGGNLVLRSYAYPLPAGLTSVDGSLDLSGYSYPLPAGLTSVGGGLDLSGYPHPLPARLLTSAGGHLDLSGYSYPLPAGLTSVDGSLGLGGYSYPLPAGLTSVGGGLGLGGYSYPLPAGLTSVGGSLFLRRYAHPLPARLTSVGGYLFLKGYEHPLPAGLTNVDGSLELAGYKHPLPAGLVVGSEFLGADDYPFPLPGAGVNRTRTWKITPNRKRSSSSPVRKTSRKPPRKTSKRAQRKTSRS
jgi:hypothetical protein